MRRIRAGGPVVRERTVIVALVTFDSRSAVYSGVVGQHADEPPLGERSSAAVVGPAPGP